MEPISTGVPGLDRVLRGGLTPRALHFVGGPPGTGKTSLAQQISYHHAGQGGRVLYLVALSESSDRLVSHASGFSFFDASLVADRIYYLSVYPRLEEGGLAAVLDEMRSLALEHKASLVCVDSISTLKAAASSSLDFRRFVFDLNAQLRSLGATILLLGPWVEAQASDPEFVVADGILVMETRSGELGLERYLEVLKLRGVDPLVGRHSMSITGDGVAIYPRLETALRAEGLSEPEQSWSRVSTGTEGLDRMLQGGVPSGSVTLLSGPVGAGKTTLGLAFLTEGSRRGEQGVYLGFDEAPSRLMSKADGLGFGFSQIVADGGIHMQWVSPLELIPDQVAWRLLELVDGSHASRLVIDSMDRGLARVEHGGRLRSLSAALMAAMRSRNVTSIFTHESFPGWDSDAGAQHSGLGADADNVVLLRYAEDQSRLRRLISVLKVAEGDFDPSVREFAIGRGGVHVAETFVGPGWGPGRTNRRRGRRPQ